MGRRVRVAVAVVGAVFAGVMSNGWSIAGASDPPVASGAQIIGGGNASADEYPFHVSVQATQSRYFLAVPGSSTVAPQWFTAATTDVDSNQTVDSRDKHVCGGTLIAPRWVLTAAHCVTGAEPLWFWGLLYWARTPADLQVLSGTETLGNGSGTVSAVDKVMVHPAWNLNSLDDFLAGAPAQANDPNLYSLEYDAALLHLASPPAGSTLPLGSADTYTPVGSNKTIIGWGETATSYFPTVLQEVVAPVQPDQVCEDAEATRPFWAGDLCVGGVAPVDPSAPRDGVVGACKGDSGSPLLGTKPDGSWVQTAIGSFGVSGCPSGLAGYWPTNSIAKWIYCKSGVQSVDTSFTLASCFVHVDPGPVGPVTTLPPPGPKKT